MLSPIRLESSSKPVPSMSLALLLIAHGSRRPAANADLARLADVVRQTDEAEETIVEIGYLELTGPTIPEGFARCVEQGATTVRIVPYFLSMGVHMQEDLTEICSELRERYPNVRIQVRKPLGLHPKVIDVVLERSGLQPADAREPERAASDADAADAGDAKPQVA